MDPEPESEPEHDNKNINNENNVLVFENEALEDEEPRLKYQRLGSDVADILHREEASCLCVSDKMLALGTHNGRIYLLSCAGDEVKCFDAHKATVKDICFDKAVEAIGSCSDDGSVVIRNLCTDEVIKLEYHRPLKTLAIDPRFSERKTRELVTGGVAGKICLSSRGWLGKRDSIIHAGEGPIHIVRWYQNYIAWANDVSIRLYDTSIHKQIGTIEYPRGSSKPSSLMECRMFWEPDGTLLIGWTNIVMITKVEMNTTNMMSMTMNMAMSNSSFSNMTNNQTSTNSNCLKLISKFEIEGIISGIAPFGHDLAILAYMKEKNEHSDESLMGIDPPSQTPTRPELRILTRLNCEISSDALSIPSCEHYEANDYVMAVVYPSTKKKQEISNESITNADNNNTFEDSMSKHFSQWWPDNEEPMYYVVCPKDIVIGRPRDEHDRVKWLLQHGKYTSALAVARILRKRDPETWDSVVDHYMEYLLSNQEYEKAAKMCPDVLRQDPDRWERYIYLFAQRRNLDTLSIYIPTENPTLKSSAYNMVLRACILVPTSHPRLLELVKRWPPGVYSPSGLSKEIQQKARSIRGDKTILMEVLALLYILQNMHDHAMEIYIELEKQDVFDFIVNHALLNTLHGKIAKLVALDEEKAINLLVKYMEDIDPVHVIQELEEVMKHVDQNKDNKKTYSMWRKRLFRYMDKLVMEDISAAADYHALLVELYADYSVDRLKHFLEMSHQYPLDVAYEICHSRKLIKEEVYVLYRMGNSQDALQLIIKELKDIPKAIEFARQHNDIELWNSLIDWALKSSSTTGDLLDQVGGHVNPHTVITRIPKGMSIWNLRNRLCKIITDYRTQTSLQEGCSHILKADCVHLAEKLYHEIKHCIQVLHISTTDSTIINNESVVDNNITNNNEMTIWHTYDSATGAIIPSTEPKLEKSGTVKAHWSSQLQMSIAGANSSTSASYSANSALNQKKTIQIGFNMEKTQSFQLQSNSFRGKLGFKKNSNDEYVQTLPSLIE